MGFGRLIRAQTLHQTCLPITDGVLFNNIKMTYLIEIGVVIVERQTNEKNNLLA
jgi:hypothetical protein